MQLRAQLLNRLVLKVDGSGTSEIAIGDKNTTASRLLGKGHMLAKVAGYSAPVFTQVPYIDPSTDLSERRFGGKLWEESARIGIQDYAVTMLSWPEQKF